MKPRFRGIAYRLGRKVTGKRLKRLRKMMELHVMIDVIPLRSIWRGSQSSVGALSAFTNDPVSPWRRNNQTSGMAATLRGTSGHQPERFVVGKSGDRMLYEAEFEPGEDEFKPGRNCRNGKGLGENGPGPWLEEESGFCAVAAIFHRKAFIVDRAGGIAPKKGGGDLNWARLSPHTIGTNHNDHSHIKKTICVNLNSACQRLFIKLPRG